MEGKSRAQRRQREKEKMDSSQKEMSKIILKQQQKNWNRHKETQREVNMNVKEFLLREIRKNAMIIIIYNGTPTKGSQERHINGVVILHDSNS